MTRLSPLALTAASWVLLATSLAAQADAVSRVESGVKEAGIALVRLRNPGSYTAPTLAAALGLQGSL